jgi:hypothetical protein
MNHMRACLIAGLCLAPGYVFAADAVLPPVDPQMSESAKPAAETPKAPESTSEAVDLLTRVQAKLDLLETLSCNIVYTRKQELLGDKQMRLGSLVFLRKPGPARFGIEFNKLIVGERQEEERKSYVYDGQWLVEKIYKQKQFFKRQIADPKAGPQEDLLESGKGPFIIPLTTRKDQILAKFSASVAAPNLKQDPDNTVHLVLIPKPGQNIEFTRIDIWYDATTLLPRKVRTTDSSQNISEVLLQEIKTNLAIDANRLDTSAPSDPGWRVEITPWDDGKKVKP